MPNEVSSISVNNNKSSESAALNGNNENIDRQGLEGNIVDRRMASMSNAMICMNTCSENPNNKRVNEDLVRGIVNYFQSL